mgnify:FL=1
MTRIELENTQAKKPEKHKKKKHNLFYKLISFLLIILSVISFSFAIYNDIFPLPLILIGGLFLVVVVFLITIILNNNRLRLWIKRLFLVLTILIIALESIFLVYGANTLEFIKSITDNGKRIDEYGVYVLNSKYSKLEDLDDKKFGYLSSEEDEKINQVIKKIDEKIDFSYHK